MNNLHNHEQAVPLGSGKLLINNITLNIISCNLYLLVKALSDEQHACITFDRAISLKKIQTVYEKFLKIQLTNPYYSPISNLSIREFTVFTPSGGQAERTQIDFLISPRINQFDQEIDKNH